MTLFYKSDRMMKEVIMIYKLSNDKLEICVKSKGAELYSLKPAGIDREYMWQAEEPYWQRQSPTLFPAVGKSISDSYLYNGDMYEMPKHGFVRDVEFDCKSFEDTLIFSYSFNDQTLVNYPFKFELLIKYHIADVLTVTYEITNHSDIDMPFSVGGHPAFNWKMDSVATLSFDVSTAEFYPVLAEGIGSGENVSLDELIMSPKVFENDALIYKGVGSVSFKNGDYSLNMSCSDFKYIGIWSQVGAPFFCLEPWSTLPDMVDHNQKLMDKEDIIILGPSSKKVLSYTLKIS